jgi:hypothetical protein
MRGLAVIASTLAGSLTIAAAMAGSADAATKKKPQQFVERSARGTVIEPTKTIIHDGYGHTTVIVVPRRSYLDTGTEVSPGDRSFKDYMLPPDGDPGRPNWFYGPDLTGSGGLPIPRAFDIPGFNPNTPY